MSRPLSTSRAARRDGRKSSRLGTSLVPSAGKKIDPIARVNFFLTLGGLARLDFEEETKSGLAAGALITGGLRSDASQSLDLEQAFSRIQQEFSVEEPSGFRVVVEGRPRPLHPLIRDEVYRIGREALVNAFRHSRASNIEVGVEYVTNHLRVTVSDDGCGIDPEVLRSNPRLPRWWYRRIISTVVEKKHSIS